MILNSAQVLLLTLKSFLKQRQLPVELALIQTKRLSPAISCLTSLQAQGKRSELTANIKLKDVDLRSLFDDRRSLFDTRTTGQLTLESHGENVVELFRELQGQAELSLVLLPEDPNPEQLSFKSAAQLVVNQDTILGVSLTNLDIDSLQQDVTGSLSMVARRSPWIIAELKADLVLLAMGFVHVTHTGLVDNLGLRLDEKGNVLVNSYQTSEPWVFAAGDTVRGASLVVHAIRSGQEAAVAINQWLR